MGLRNAENIGTKPQDYPVEIIHEPFDCDFQNDDGIAAWVESLVQAPSAEILSTASDTNA